MIFRILLQLLPLTNLLKTCFAFIQNILSFNTEIQLLPNTAGMFREQSELKLIYNNVQNFAFFFFWQRYLERY